MKSCSVTIACSILLSEVCQGTKWRGAPCLEKLRCRAPATDVKQSEKALRLYHAVTRSVCKNTTSFNPFLSHPRILGVSGRVKSQSKNSFWDSSKGSQDLTSPIACPHHNSFSTIAFPNLGWSTNLFTSMLWTVWVKISQVSQHSLKWQAFTDQAALTRAALLADSAGKDLARRGSQGSSKKAENALARGGKAKLQRAKFC